MVHSPHQMWRGAPSEPSQPRERPTLKHRRAPEWEGRRGSAAPVSRGVTAPVSHPKHASPVLFGQRKADNPLPEPPRPVRTPGRTNLHTSSALMAAPLPQPPHSNYPPLVIPHPLQPPPPPTPTWGGTVTWSKKHRKHWAPKAPKKSFL